MGLGVSVEEYRRDLQDRIQKAQWITRHNVREAQEQQETYYNRRARARTFQPGDQVLVLILTTSSKQLAMWQGPFSVIRQVGPVDYEVRKPGHLREQQVYHVNRLKEWKTPQGWMAQEKAVEEFHEVFQESPGRTASIQHKNANRMPLFFDMDRHLLLYSSGLAILLFFWISALYPLDLENLMRCIPGPVAARHPSWPDVHKTLAGFPSSKKKPPEYKSSPKHTKVSCARTNQETVSAHCGPPHAEAPLCPG
ncbi:hypothetical protein Y1Q_0000332 [Alligator mississippiensis]|uniref:Integrase p58-like C-terminal domain-containing protein n=1 Tax=Alligator mississippiensis TaxID=8496 RepID=A0A151LZB3_ALLMI|nr:hypothetical protein Y1Q_0000332 [Alligator mississippiensis]